MRFSILKRIKSNKTGEVISYEVLNCDTGVVDRVSAVVLIEGVVKQFFTVINASLVNNAYFRANKGCKIDTVVDNLSLSSTAIVRGSNTDNSIKQVEVSEAYGVKFINICRKIREFALSNKLIFNEVSSSVKSISLVESSGVRVADFIKGYLSVIQPFSLELYLDDDAWLCDIGFNTSLVMKFNEQDYLVVSLQDGTKSHEFDRKALDSNLCAVIVETPAGSYDGEKSIPVKFIVQRGFLRQSVSAVTKKLLNGVAFIKYSYINDAYQSLLDNILDKLGQYYYESDDIHTLQLNISGASFLSLGYGTPNNISLLIDCFSVSSSKTDRGAILELASNLLSELSIDALQGLKSALLEKYGKSDFSNALYDQIMQYK